VRLGLLRLLAADREEARGANRNACGDASFCALPWGSARRSSVDIAAPSSLSLKTIISWVSPGAELVSASFVTPAGSVAGRPWNS
jgi:hypothetical protein